jgi:hypothetical protein
LVERWNIPLQFYKSALQNQWWTLHLIVCVHVWITFSVTLYENNIIHPSVCLPFLWKSQLKCVSQSSMLMARKIKIKVCILQNQKYAKSFEVWNFKAKMQFKLCRLINFHRSTWKPQKKHNIVFYQRAAKSSAQKHTVDVFQNKEVLIYLGRWLKSV